jgi:4-azaleucine resistance transporter AzlC
MSQGMSPPTRARELLAGMRDTIPLIVGAVPFGFIFGALAVSNGVSPAAAQGLSLFVYAGSAQFIAVGLVAQQAATLAIIGITFVVNLRHALYAATLAPYVRHLPQWLLLPMGFWLTDETFVVSIRRYQQSDASPHKHWYYLGSALLMYLNWQLSTLIGIVAGSSIPDLTRWGLDFALYVTFLGMLIPMLKDRPSVASAMVAGGVALAAQGLPHQLWLILAALAGVIAGVWLERRQTPTELAAAPEGPV